MKQILFSYFEQQKGEGNRQVFRMKSSLGKSFLKWLLAMSSNKEDIKTKTTGKKCWSSELFESRILPPRNNIFISTLFFVLLRNQLLTSSWPVGKFKV